MSSPESGGAYSGTPSKSAPTAKLFDACTGSGEYHRGVSNTVRYAACAALGTVALTLIAYCAFYFAMRSLGPPRIATVGHLLPTSYARTQDNTPDPALDPDDVDPRYLAFLFTFEDRRFYSHYGVDPTGILRAVRDLVVKQRIVTGGSTLTMQVARLLDNQYRRSPAVKLHQIMRAVQLESTLSKKEILGLYLALAPFGGHTKGVRAASLKFFGKEPRHLSIAQAALLVALPQAPEARRIDRRPDAARRARNFIIDTVTSAGLITPSEAELAKLEPLTTESSTMPPNPLPKPSTTKVASFFAGLTVGINFVTGIAVASPMTPTAEPRFLGSGEELVLDVRRKLLRPQPAGTHQDDRDALWMFYAARSASVWVNKTGWTPKAQAVIDEIKRADDWGLRADAFEIPELPAEAHGVPALSAAELADAEVGLSRAIMKYARYARGGRIEDPATQLSTYLDRKPQVRPAFLVINDVANATAPDAYLRKLHPQNKQFARLREFYLAQRDGSETARAEIPSGSKLKPGTTHADIALIRERLHIPASGDDPTLYDDRLVDAVKRFQEKRGIEPASGIITTKTRRAMNENENPPLKTILANMEQWRWMPDDLGEAYVWVNVPEFMVRVIKDDKVVHSERVITGTVNNQTPIFSEDMKTIYFHPRWNIPQSIKVNEIGPAIARGRRRDLVVMRNGKIVRPGRINWSKSDIRNYDIFQPSGPGNALGLMKFTFPNKHSVYLHDTQSKGLFSSTQRTFSHGCVRVRNPQRLAEVLLDIDKGWTSDDVAKLIKVKGTPEENGIDLNQHIPVHITYFTAEVDDEGEVTTQKDVYGHEKRISQALQGKWKDIDKGSDHLAPEQVSRRNYDSDDNAKPNRKHARRNSNSHKRVAAGGGSGRSSSRGGGGSAMRVSSSGGSSANDVFRRSFGY